MSVLGNPIAEVERLRGSLARERERRLAAETEAGRRLEALEAMRAERDAALGTVERARVYLLDAIAARDEAWEQAYQLQRALFAASEELERVDADLAAMGLGQSRSPRIRATAEACRLAVDGAPGAPTPVPSSLPHGATEAKAGEPASFEVWHAKNCANVLVTHHAPCKGIYLWHARVHDAMRIAGKSMRERFVGRTCREVYEQESAAPSGPATANPDARIPRPSEPPSFDVRCAERNELTQARCVHGRYAHPDSNGVGGQLLHHVSADKVQWFTVAERAPEGGC